MLEISSLNHCTSFHTVSSHTKPINVESYFVDECAWIVTVLCIHIYFVDKNLVVNYATAASVYQLLFLHRLTYCVSTY